MQTANLKSLNPDNNVTNIRFIVGSNDGDVLNNNSLLDISWATQVLASDPIMKASTTDEVLISGSDSEENVSYQILADSVAVIEDCTSGSSTFYDASIHQDYAHFIYGTENSIYISEAPYISDKIINLIINQNTPISGVPIYGSSNLVAGSAKNLNIIGGQSNSDVYTIGGFLGLSGSDFNITNLYNFGEVMGSGNMAYNGPSVIVGNMNGSKNLQEILIGRNSNTLLVAGNNSLEALQNGATGLGYNGEGTTQFEVESGNVDVYGFTSATNIIDFSNYRFANEADAVLCVDIDEKMSASNIAMPMNGLLSTLDQTSAVQLMLGEMGSIANYEIGRWSSSAAKNIDSTDLVPSTGVIYNATTYIVGNQNSNITLGADYSSVAYRNNLMTEDLKSPSYTNNLCINGQSEMAVLGYGVNTVAVNGLNSSITFSNVQLMNGSTNLLVDATAENNESIYNIKYKMVVSADQIDNQPDSFLNLAGAGGTVNIDDSESRNDYGDISFCNEDGSGESYATKIHVTENSSGAYVFNDNYDNLTNHGLLNIDLNQLSPDTNHCNVFNISSVLEDLTSFDVALVQKAPFSSTYDLMIGGRACAELTQALATNWFGAIEVNLRGVTTTGEFTSSKTVVFG